MSGKLTIEVNSVSVPSRGLGADSGGSAPVWSRVLVTRSTEPWINTATFSAEVGWREKDASTEETEEGKETPTEEEETAKEPMGPFSFWPAPLPNLLPEDFGEDVGEDEIPKQKPNWAWSAVRQVTPDIVRNAPAEAASSVWEQTLATLSEDDIARTDMGYLYPTYNGAAPQCSGDIPLTRHHVTAVLNSSIIIEVYRGSDRNPETDVLVGRASFGSEIWNGERLIGGENGMARVLTYAGGVNIELQLEPPSTEANEEGEVPAVAFSEPATVGISVSANDKLLEYCLGSRVFTCLVSGVPMCDNEGAIAIPNPWKIPCTAGEVKESDGTWESLTYSVACDLPNTGAEVGRLTGGVPCGFPVPIDAMDEAATEEGDGETGDGSEENIASATTTAAPIDIKSMMAINWSGNAASGSVPSAPATLMRAFLPRSEVDALVSQSKTLVEDPSTSSTSSTSWSAIITRSLFENESETKEETTNEEEDGAETTGSLPPPASNYQIDIPIVTSLTVPGVSYLNSRFALNDVTGNPSIQQPDSNVVEEEVEDGDVVGRIVSKIGPELQLYVQFNMPLVTAPPPPPEPVLMPSDIVAARPAAPRAPPVSAVNLLRGEVRTAATSIVTEIYSLFGNDVASQSMSADQRRRQLLYHLNTGGAYHALRERLKHSMGRLVKERFPAEAALAPGSVEHGKFVSELYVFLMEEVFSVINDMFAEGAGGPTVNKAAVAGEKEEKSEEKENKENKTEPSMLISTESNSAPILMRLGALAEEAELSGDLDLALRYHQDRVVASEGAAERRHVRQVEGGGATPWIEYAAFAARCGDFPKADECCREAIALSLPETATSTQSGDADPSALLMQSALMSRNGDQDMAKIMLSPLTTEENPDARACTMLSIIHLRCDRETKKAEKAMKRAIAAATNGVPSASRFDLYHDLAAWLVCRGLGDMASFVLGVAAKEGKAGNDDAANNLDDATIAWTATNMEREQRVKHLWLGGATALASGDLDRAEALLRAAVEVEEGCGPAWSVLGHVLARKSTTGNSNAIDAFQTALPLLEAAQKTSDVLPTLPVAQLGQLYNSLGFLYLQQGPERNAGAAKEVYLRACRLSPTSTGWLGAGIAALELGKYAEAEDALAEANILNNQNPQIWGYLALLCLQSAMPRVEEADQSLNQATRLGLGDPTLLERIGASYAALGCYRQAESTLRRATASLDVDTSRKLLGDVMAAQNKFEAALQEYETVVGATTTSDAVRKEAIVGQNRMLEALGIGSKTAWKE